MAKFVLSAFADEFNSSIDKQIEGLIENGVRGIEIRGVDGTNIADITLDKAKEVRAKFDKAGIIVTSIGSPIGKIKLTDDFEAHLEKLRHVIEIAKILGTDRIRMFSFYMENDADYSACRNEVMAKLGRMLEIAKAEGVILCHENEKGIYGDNAERCLDIQKEFDGEIKCVFDPANFVECEVETYPHAFNLLKDYILYFHIKDALGMGRIVPAGEGMGHIPEIIAEASKIYDRDVILSVEPHLSNFDGFAALEKEGITEFKKDKSNSEITFGIAVSAIKKIIEK